MKINFFLYSMMLFSGAGLAFFSSDEAAKWVRPEALFWIKGGFAVCNAYFTGIKAFTSSSFQDWLAKKKAGLKTGDTDFYSKTNTGP